MKTGIAHLAIRQLDEKLATFGLAANTVVPAKGWIQAIRKSVGMSLQQLADKLKTTPQNVHGIEVREASGAVTINSLKEVAEAMDMKLVYGFVPKDESLEKWIDRKAYEAAKRIVLRTSQTMKLEDQENSAARIEQAIRERAEEIKRELPKYLWS